MFSTSEQHPNYPDELIVARCFPVRQARSQFCFSGWPTSIEAVADDKAGKHLVRTALGENVARIRALRGMTVRELSARLKELGLQLSASGVSEVENAGRKVSVEELLVFALALNTSVIDLLVTKDGRPLAIADGVDPLDPGDLERWLQGRGPWPPPPPGPQEGALVEEFLSTASQPRKDAWRREQRPEVDAVDRLRAYLLEVIRAQEDPDGYGKSTPFDPKNMSNVLRMLSAEVDGYVKLLASKLERDGYGG